MVGMVDVEGAVVEPALVIIEAAVVVVVVAVFRVVPAALPDPTNLGLVPVATAFNNGEFKIGL